jgi:glycosyltransferase involved in cell wall biosynthesis
MISVVIITKNESHIISKTLAALQGLTNDIVIGDSGSTDNTIEISKQFGVNLLQFNWQGFGHAKNTVIAAAKYNWVLALDADEVLSEALVQELKQLSLTNTNELFVISFLNFIGNRKLQYGDWTNVSKVRLFNRTFTKWEDKPIHESVIRPTGTVITKLQHRLYHYCHTDLFEYAQKMTHYGNDMAQRYFNEGKKASFFKLYIYPRFIFFYNYLIRLGFLDGSVGYEAAKMYSYYVFIKYHRLKELQNKNK